LALPDAFAVSEEAGFAAGFTPSVLTAAFAVSDLGGALADDFVDAGFALSAAFAVSEEAGFAKGFAPSVLTAAFAVSDLEGALADDFVGDGLALSVAFAVSEEAGFAGGFAALAGGGIGDGFGSRAIEPAFALSPFGGDFASALFAGAGADGATPFSFADSGAEGAGALPADFSAAGLGFDSAVVSVFAGSAGAGAGFTETAGGGPGRVMIRVSTRSLFCRTGGVFTSSLALPGSGGRSLRAKPPESPTIRTTRNHFIRTSG